MASPVDEIKARLDVAGYIGRDVRLQKSGRYLKGLCPFHSEKTPSFFVFPERGTFKCFGCGEGGDLFTFVMRRDRTEFPDALRTLAREAGVELERQADPVARQRRASIMAALAEAAKVMHRILLESPVAEHARAYVAKRGLTRPAVDAFHLGYAPAHGSPVLEQLTQLGFTREILEAAELVRVDERGARDYFFDRLVFPIWDRQGAVVGFGARAFGEVQPKYLNTAESEVFTKGHLLYAYHLAREAIRREGTVVIVEGYMDAIAAHEHGFLNTVASMGTSLTTQQAETLSGAAKRIVLALDADAAGAAATRRGIDVLRAAAAYEDAAALDFRGLVRHQGRLVTDIGIVELPAGEDPDSLIRTDAERWRSLLRAPVLLADYYFRWALQARDLSSLSGRAEAVRELLPVLAEIRDDVVRAHYYGRLADHAGLPVDELRRMSRAPRARSRPESQTAAPARPSDGWDEGLLEELVHASSDHQALLAEIEPALVQDPELRHAITRALDVLRRDGRLAQDVLLAAVDPSLHARVSAIYARARAKSPLDEVAYARSLRSVALRLRVRRLEADIHEAKVVHESGDAAASSREFLALRQRLAEERERVRKSLLDVSVVVAGSA